MLVRDVMTRDVVTIPSTTSIYDAKKTMEKHKFRRLLVVDKKEKLVGIITEHGLEKVSPSKASSLTIWEMNYLLAKTTVAEVMTRELVTVTPDMTVEEAISLAQSRMVGSLIVIEDSKVVGIVTTNDFFVRIINPMLGIRQPGTRIEIPKGGDPETVGAVMEVLKGQGVGILALHTFTVPGKEENDFCVHVDTEDTNKIIEELNSLGYEVRARAR